ncbi:unnamed protein product [Vitrella brassicaformis CCMP3155]|uniref:RING-type domain-containing protein n=2 Tax=Vitrella brassicaformis TaxID=1169539 RepID=A0A0G4G4G1_VITBC|nr:unnamed protein product [Vitrella brassicaformis CCMP3155]|eukprot:CEM23239.1 unnamed protein product [Vitrella brassicaformis CCMP3155]
MDEFGTGLRVSVIRRTLVVTALVSFNAFVLFPAFLGARTWLFPEIGLDWVFLPVGFACMCALACPGGITRIGGCLFLLAPIIVLVAIQTGQLWVAHLSFLPFYFALLGALRFHAVMMSSLQMQLEMTLACGGISRLPFANTGDLIIFFCYVFVTNLLPLSGIAYAYGMRIWNRKICVAFVVWILYNCTTAIQSFFLPGFPPYLLVALPILFGCLAIVISLEMFLNWRRLETLSFFNPGTGLDSRELQQLRSTVLHDPAEIGCDFCTICQDHICVGQMVTSLPNCPHQFHTACINLWLRQKAICPNCNMSVRSSEPRSAGGDSNAQTDGQADQPPPSTREVSPNAGRFLAGILGTHGTAAMGEAGDADASSGYGELPDGPPHEGLGSSASRAPTISSASTIFPWMFASSPTPAAPASASSSGQAAAPASGYVPPPFVSSSSQRAEGVGSPAGEPSAAVGGLGMQPLGHPHPRSHGHPSTRVSPAPGGHPHTSSRSSLGRLTALHRVMSTDSEPASSSSVRNAGASSPPWHWDRMQDGSSIAGLGGSGGSGAGGGDDGAEDSRDGGVGVGVVVRGRRRRSHEEGAVAVDVLIHGGGAEGGTHAASDGHV